MNANRQWMYNRLKDGLLNTEFLNGLEEFIQFASTHPECMDGMNIRCPCSMKRCSNRRFLCVDDVRYHLMKNGFVPNYYRWTAHGECWDDQGTSSVLMSETIMENDFQTGTSGRYHEMVLEGFGLPPQIEFMEEAPNAEAQRLYEMLQAASEELWPGCNKHTKLSAVARLMNMKSEHHFSVKCFDQIVEFLKEVLPEDNVLPDNFYKTKKLIEGLGLPVEKIDCCRNNCMIYWSGDAELQECKFCQLPRYKRTENYLKLKEQHSSQNVGSDHVEGDGGNINEDQLFIAAAGGWQGSRVYGLGSAASSAFSQTGTVEKTTDVPSSQSPEWKKEIEAKFDEKYNSLQKLVEDQNQIIAQMRDELQATRMGQQSSSLMPSTSDMPPAQRSPGDSHID
ncbi:uncharacterized protein LOC122724542 [Manihot esculenta]|uniref:uncharacterized protein LOC122724542 n=1 Tax=Manihot esculenta TaxID=3983 RepID=UPI001CC33FFB|nr:uncharacterized protein LOC122724542 [Manihot esculenta]